METFCKLQRIMKMDIHTSFKKKNSCRLKTFKKKLMVMTFQVRRLFDDILLLEFEVKDDTSETRI